MNIILDGLIAQQTENMNEYANLKSSLSNSLQQQSSIELVDYLIRLIKEDIRKKI